MMFSQTVCKPGAYVEVVPVGLLATIQYNARGIVEKIYQGSESEGTEVSKDAFKVLQMLVPSSIPVTGGTTWVNGVFYSPNISSAPGHIPECVYSDYVKRVEEGEQLEFYAATASSLAVSFAGSVNIRNWLNVAKFNVLPGIIVPNEFNESTLEMLLNTGAYNFEYPYIAGYQVFVNTSSKFVPSNLHQLTVKSTSKFADDNGYIHVKITPTEGDPIVINYTDYISHNIQTGTSVLYYIDTVVKVVKARNVDGKKREPISKIYLCPTCGKKSIVPKSGSFRCEDNRCLSNLYPDSQKFLSTLHLPTVTADRYFKAVSMKEILCLTDLTSLPEFDSFEPSGTMAEVLHAIVPVDVCNDTTFFERLSSSCNHSIDTLFYYLDNPLRIETDLDISSVAGKRFISWIASPENILDVKSTFSDVTVVKPEAKFDGAPIFRNMLFVVTGKFKRGDYREIESILKSYSAEVRPDIDDKLPNCIIVGSTLENISGELVKKARIHNIPVVEEDTFFAQYEIDSDMMSNLL